MPQYDERRTQTNTNSTTNTGSTETGTNSQQLVGNAAIVEYIRQNNQSTGPRELDPNKNGIVFMGFNAGAHAEGRALNNLNAGSGGAITATPRSQQDTAVANGKVIDLSTMEGVAKFSTSLGLPDQLAVNVTQFMVDASGESKDELAQFIRILSQAEMGERQIDRMVLSGHSVGGQLWGDHNGEVDYDQFSELFKMFPKAAEQVTHLMMSACYGGGETTMTEYQNMLPGLESIWAYHDSSPGTWTGAIDHMKAWESATEKGKPAAGVDPELAGRYRKGKNVATWNTNDGYQGGEPMTIEELEGSLNDQEAMFQRHYSGAEEVATPQSGPLRVYYGLVQRAVSHPDSSPQLRSKMEERRDQTIRLLYYKLVSGKFQAHNQGALSKGFSDAGVTLPDLAAIGRGGVRRVIDELKASVSSGDSQKALDLMQRGMWDLDKNLIPTSWI